VIGPDLRVNTALFYYRVDDLISFGHNSNGNSTFGNVAGATSQGGEIELDATPAVGWRGRLSYTYAEARDSTSGLRLTDSPENVAKFSLTAPVWHQAGSSTLEVLGMSSRTTVQSNTLGAYAVVNLSFLSRPIANGFRISVGVYNLFDKQYSDPVGTDFLEDSVRQDGRQFRIKITEKF
jgi:outer membrane receptor for ferrienterochelin and colicins